MNGKWLLVVLALVAWPALARWQSGSQKRGRSVAMQVLSDNALRAGREPDSAIALVQVESLESGDESRPNSVQFTKLAVVRVISGALPKAVNALFFATGGGPKLISGHRYILLLRSVGGKDRIPDRIVELVEVTKGSEDEAVKVHLREYERTRTLLLRLEDRVLQDLDGSSDAVVLVKANSVSIATPGSRDEHVSVELAVERTLLGVAPTVVVAWRHTKGDPLLAVGHRYIVSISRLQGAREWPSPGDKTRGVLLGSFVEVPEGREEEAVQMHLRAIERLKKARP